jgi:hypothetical protein
MSIFQGNFLEFSRIIPINHPVVFIGICRKISDINQLTYPL